MQIDFFIEFEECFNETKVEEIYSRNSLRVRSVHIS